MPAVIGALRAELSASIAQFQTDMGRAANAVTAMATRAQRDAQRVQAAGRTMTLALTAPIAAFAAASLHVAGDFEASMNRVQGATGATTAQLAQLTAAARAFGQDRRFTATAREAADVMETLAKNGLSTAEILGGATRATLTLAAATGAQYGPAADVATSAMQQFHVQAGELTGVVDGIVGTLIQSRFGFEDYAQALGQAGGVAGGLGVSLTDFNTVLAATGTLFTSGSDAGTSFKTFLTSLTPTSQQARAMMQRLNLSFFNANGSMRSMGEIAQMLQDRLRPLSDQARTQALQVIFGRDAMRTAIGLMNQGSAGLERLSRLIAQGSAQQQMEIRMRGLNGAIRQVQRSAENLMIALGNSGLLEAVAGLVRGVGTVLDRLAALPPQMLAVATVIAGVVAAIGPLLVIFGTVAGAIAQLAPLLPILASGFATVAGVLIGPWGVAIATAVAAVLLFRDQIMAVLNLLAQQAQQILGPTFQRIMADFQRIWTTLTTGPIGAAITGLVQILGTLAAALLNAFGTSAIGLLNIFLGVFERVLSAVADLLTAVSRLLQGDFVGAWNAAFNAINTLTAGILGAVVGTLGAIAQAIGQLISGALAQLPEAWRQAAVIGVGWARTLYEGVASWINDHLAPVIHFAMGLINGLNAAFAALRGQAPPAAPGVGTAPVSAIGGGLAGHAALVAPPRQNPDLSQVGQHHGPSAEERAAAAAARRVEEARQRLAEGIRDLNDQVEHGLGDRQLPATTQAADQLRRRIADITEDAQRAGVSTAAFGGQLGALRARIAELETAGLAREAATFGRAVDADTRSVREFSNGGLAPLEERLQAVDDNYQQVRARIQEHIEANRELAARNTDAAHSMEELQHQLQALTAAHQAARDAATAQYNAEKHLADLQAMAATASTQTDIRDLHQARGDNGVMTSQQQHMQEIQDRLNQQRIAAEQHLAELQAQLTDAQRVGDQDAIARLQVQVEAQQQLYDLVSQTTATQISAQERLQSAFTSFTDSLNDSLSDMIVNWRGDLSGIRNAFKQILRDLVVKPALNWLQQAAQGAIQSMMSGGGWSGGGIPPFAGGGSFMVGGGGPTLKGVGIDRHLVSIRARTGEQVTVATPSQQRDAADAMHATGRGGSPVFAPYIDARGAGPREVDQLKGVIDRMQRNFKSMTWDAVNEGVMRQKIAPPSFS